MAALVGSEGDLRAGAAGEDVGEAAHAVDGDLRVAGGDEDLHDLILAEGGPAVVRQLGEQPVQRVVEGRDVFRQVRLERAGVRLGPQLL